MTESKTIDNTGILAEEIAKARAAEAAKAEAERAEAEERERRKYVLALASGEGLALGKRYAAAAAPDKPALLCEREGIGKHKSWSGIPLGKIALLAGDAGVGKSTLALQLAVIVASGGKVRWAGHWVRQQGRVVYLGAEDDAALIARRIRFTIGALDIHGDPLERLERNLLLPPGRLPAGSSLIDTQRMSLAPKDDGTETHNGRFVNSVSATYTKPGDVLDALKALTQGPLGADIKLIVIDPLNAFSATDVETDPDVAGALMRHAGDLAEKTGATVLFTHHTRKPPQSHGGKKTYAPDADSIRGTSALKAQVRWAGIVYAGAHKSDDQASKEYWELTATDAASGAVTFRTVKANDGLDWTPPHTMKRNGRGVLVDANPGEIAELRNAYRDDDPDAKPKEDPDALAAEAAEDAI